MQPGPAQIWGLEQTICTIIAWVRDVGHPVTIGQSPAHESHTEQSMETRKTPFCSSKTLKSYAGDWPTVTGCPTSLTQAIIVQMVYCCSHMPLQLALLTDLNVARRKVSAPSRSSGAHQETERIDSPCLSSFSLWSGEAMARSFFDPWKVVIVQQDSRLRCWEFACCRSSSIQRNCCLMSPWWICWERPVSKADACRFHRMGCTVANELSLQLIEDCKLRSRTSCWRPVQTGILNPSSVYLLVMVTFRL